MEQQELERDQMTPAILLPVFYRTYNLGDDGGQRNSNVRIDVTKRFHFNMPNYNARRAAVLWHDIHHLVTGYSAGTFLGECEISAWEIAAGCGKYWAAFLIDTSGVMLGCFIHPMKIMHAYARGRKTMSLYHDAISKEEVMNSSIRDLRIRLRLDQYPMNTKVGFQDVMMLCLFLVFAGLYSILSIITIPMLIVYNVWYVLKKKDKYETDSHSTSSGS